MAAGLERLLSWNKAQGEKNVGSFQLEIQIIANRIKYEKRRQEEKEGSNTGKVNCLLK